MGSPGSRSSSRERTAVFAAYFGDRYDRAAILDELGRDFQGADTLYKAWPCVGTVHSHIHAVIDIVRDHDLAAAANRRDPGVRRRLPRTELHPAAGASRSRDSRRRAVQPAVPRRAGRHSPGRLGPRLHRGGTSGRAGAPSRCARRARARFDTRLAHRTPAWAGTHHDHRGARPSRRRASACPAAQVAHWPGSNW